VIPGLSAGGVRVLLSIIRLTYGWQKQADRISLSQLQRTTGLSRQGVVNGLRDLDNLVIIRPGKQGVGANEYALNLDISTGQLVKNVDQSVVNDIDQSKNLTSQSRHKKVVNKVDPSKENISKESRRSLSRQKTNPDIRAFIDWWAEKYIEEVGEKYRFNGGKEGALIGAELGNFTLAKLQELATRFFATDDEWITEKGGFTIGVFCSQINKLNSTGRKPTAPRKEMPA